MMFITTFLLVSLIACCLLFYVYILHTAQRIQELEKHIYEEDHGTKFILDRLTTATQYLLDKDKETPRKTADKPEPFSPDRFLDRFTTDGAHVMKEDVVYLTYKYKGDDSI